MKTAHTNRTDNSRSSRHFLQMLVFVSCLVLSHVACADETCTLNTQLNDPVIRADYETIIAESRTNRSTQNVDDYYATIQSAGFSEEVSYRGRKIATQLDPISTECLNCHDGINAKSVQHRMSDGNANRTKSIETIIGAHPVGMDYDRFSRGRKYVTADRLPADMVLMDGKVTCVTCHNLLGSTSKYLAVDNTSSRLCFSCHII